jgi:protein O-mannosyl-transferase
MADRDTSQVIEHWITGRRGSVIATMSVVLLVLIAYANSFRGALVFDDRAEITENASIKQLWPLTIPLSPPAEAGTGGRPMANLTLALNYAVSGLNTWSYHIANFAIHTMAALVLFGVVRRSLSLPGMDRRCQHAAGALALTTALLWAVHPLQTQVVTYLSQRTEELMGLFYLLTVYCFIRGATGSSRGWHIAAVAVCFLGMLSKEVMVTAPVMVLLYDRIFIGGSFREAWARRRFLYLGLAATWLVLPLLMHDVKTRGVGYGLGISAFQYALTESKAVVVYLRLSLWPRPLIFDYGIELLKRISDALPYLVLLGVFLTAAVVALRRWSRAGFAAAWVFLILAPGSSVVPILQQPIAESRMYLSLAGILVLVIVGGYIWLGSRVLVAGFLLVIAGVGLTLHRNPVYRSEESLWRDVIAKRPENPRAHYNLGVWLDLSGRRAEAVTEYKVAIVLSPTYADAHNNFGNALLEEGRVEEAIQQLKIALRVRPTYVDAHYNMGNALVARGDIQDAISHYETCLRLAPPDAKTLNNLGSALLRVGQVDRAISNFEAAIKLNPKFADPQGNLGTALYYLGRTTDAIRAYQQALTLDPDHLDARHNLAEVLLETDAAAAIQHDQRILGRHPEDIVIRNNLAGALAKFGRAADAIAQYEEVLRLKSDDADAQRNLAALRAASAATATHP